MRKKSTTTKKETPEQRARKIIRKKQEKRKKCASQAAALVRKAKKLLEKAETLSYKAADDITVNTLFHINSMLSYTECQEYGSLNEMSYGDQKKWDNFIRVYEAAWGRK